MRTYSIVSFESTEGTNSLLMKRPVGTVILRPVLATLRVTDWAMVCCRRRVGGEMVVWEKERFVLVNKVRGTVAATGR